MSKTVKDDEGTRSLWVYASINSYKILLEDVFNFLTQTNDYDFNLVKWLDNEQGGHWQNKRFIVHFSHGDRNDYSKISLLKYKGEIKIAYRLAFKKQQKKSKLKQDKPKNTVFTVQYLGADGYHGKVMRGSGWHVLAVTVFPEWLIKVLQAVIDPWG